jgi:hypothetical protein
VCDACVQPQRFAKLRPQQCVTAARSLGAQAAGGLQTLHDSFRQTPRILHLNSINPSEGG